MGPLDEARGGLLEQGRSSGAREHPPDIFRSDLTRGQAEAIAEILLAGCRCAHRVRGFPRSAQRPVQGLRATAEPRVAPRETAADGDPGEGERREEDAGEERGGADLLAGVEGLPAISRRVEIGPDSAELQDWGGLRGGGARSGGGLGLFLGLAQELLA